MHVFENFNQDSNCFICGNNHNGKTVLIPIDGTKDDGIEEAAQVHLDCINVRCDKGERNAVLYQLLEGKGNKGENK